MKKNLAITFILAITLSACTSAAGQEPSTAASPAPQESPTAATATPDNRKKIRLYFPNHIVASQLNQLVYEKNMSIFDLDQSGLDPCVHVEVTMGSTNFECATPYTYIEVPISDEEYTPENAIRMLLSYQLSEEERKAGFYHELNGFGLELISFEEVVDDDGEISAMLNEINDDYMEDYGHEKTQPGALYVVMKLEDPQHNYFQLSESDAYLYYLEEAYGAGLTEEQVDISCWFYTPGEQINQTLLQFYPTYENYNMGADYSKADGTGNWKFIYADKIAFSGCGDGTSCESMLTYNEATLDQDCHTTKIYGRDYLFCEPEEDLGYGMVDESLSHLQNLTNVCLNYPDTYVCEWPQVQETLK